MPVSSRGVDSDPPSMEASAERLRRATADAQTAIGGVGPAFTSMLQAIALVTGAPSAAASQAVLNANPTIAPALGAAPSF